MKNIHVLATSQPSTLIKDIWKNTFSLVEDFDINHTDFKPQHIYITNSKEIKIGDYYYLPRTNSVYKCIEDPTELNLERRLGIAKITLTTDGDLIKDGVQAIDDEFLEWFCKNSNCESVKVDLLKRGIYDEYKYKIIIPKSELANKLKQILDNMSQEEFNEEWKKITDLKLEGPSIIIPKEEPKLSNICIKCGVDLYALEGKFVCLKHPKECKGIYLSKETLLIHAAEQKQHLIDMMRNDEELGLYDEPKKEYKYIGECNGNNGNGCFLDSSGHDCGCFTRVLKEEPKKETTLEEVAHKMLSDYGIMSMGQSIGVLEVKKLMVKMAKWQQERSYSEEEVLELLYKLWEANPRNIKEWFEQFKKK